MSIMTGVTSGKFVLMAAGLLLHGRIDDVPGKIAIVPAAPLSAIAPDLLAKVDHRSPATPIKIGIRGSSFRAVVATVEEPPFPGADLRIGRDLLDAHPIEIDFRDRSLKLLLPGEARHEEAKMTAVSVAKAADGALSILVSIGDAPPVAATLDLSSLMPAEAAATVTNASTGTITLRNVQTDDSGAPKVSLSAFAGRAIILDLSYDRLWVGK